MVIELGGSVFEITHDLVGDLFRAKNAGVTAVLCVHVLCFTFFAGFKQDSPRFFRGPSWLSPTIYDRGDQ
jgi:hypothetical protein